MDIPFEDFAIDGSFHITAMDFKNRKITYSRNLDHYQYRVLQKLPK